MAVPKDRSRNKTSDSELEEHDKTVKQLQTVQLNPDPEFPIQLIESCVNEGELTNARISVRVHPCEDVEGETPEESSVSALYQTASDDLTGLGQSGECASQVGEDSRNVEGLPSAKDKLVNDQIKSGPCLTSLVLQCENLSTINAEEETVNTEKDLLKNDEAFVQDTCKNGQPFVQDTCERGKSQSCIPEHQTVAEEDLTAGEESPMGILSVPRSNGPHLVAQIKYMLFFVIYGNGPYFVAQIMYMHFSVIHANGPHLVAQIMYMHFSVIHANGPHLVAQMMYMHFSVHHANRPYLMARMMYMYFSLHGNGLYVVARTICMQCVLLCPRKACVLCPGKAGMKPVHHSLFVKELVIKRNGFSTADQRKYCDKTLRSLSLQTYNQVVQVYAVPDYNFVPGVLTQNTNQLPLQFMNPQQHQHNNPAVEFLDCPIQHPVENDAGELAISDQLLPQFFSPQQQQPDPVAVEVLDGPIQHPVENDAGELAVSDQLPPQFFNPQQQQHVPELAVSDHGPPL